MRAHPISLEEGEEGGKEAPVTLNRDEPDSGERHAAAAAAACGERSGTPAAGESAARVGSAEPLSSDDSEVEPPVEQHEEEATDNSALHEAAKAGDAPALAALLAAGSAPDPRNSKGQTPLHIACEKGQLECARILLAAGADVAAGAEVGGRAGVGWGLGGIVFNCFAVLPGQSHGTVRAQQCGGALQGMHGQYSVPLLPLAAQTSTPLHSCAPLPSCPNTPQFDPQPTHIQPHPVPTHPHDHQDDESATPMHAAAEGGSVEVLQLLVDEGGAELEPWSDSYGTPVSWLLDSASRSQSILV